LLEHDENKFYAAIMMKRNNIDQIIQIYSMEHSYNPSLKEVMNNVMYSLYSQSDSPQLCNKILNSSSERGIFDTRRTSWQDKFLIFRFEEPEEILYGYQEHKRSVYDRWSRLKPFHPSNDDSDEDSNDTDHDTVSDRDSNDDSLSEFSAVSDNIVSSDSEDGAGPTRGPLVGHHFFRKSNDYGDSDFSEASSISEDREDDARSACYEDTDSGHKEDASS